MIKLMLPVNKLFAITLIVVATVSFSSATYHYDEGAGDVQITITRSRNIVSKAIVLVASDNFLGTAAGREITVHVQPLSLMHYVL